MRSIEIPEPVAEDWRAAGYWSGQRIVDAFLGTADRHPNRPAVVDETGLLTYAEAREYAGRLAGWLASKGVGRGDVVSIQLPNWRETYLIHLALNFLGAVANPMLPLYKEKDLRHIMRTCRTKVLVLPEVHRSNTEFLEVARTLAAELPDLAAVLVVRPTQAKLPDLTTFDQALQSSPVEAVGPASPNDVALVAFTSGTESAPKGCVHTHNSMLYGMQALVQTMNLRSGEPIYATSPVGHGTGYTWGLRLGMHLGSTVVLQDKWDPAVAADMLSTHRCVFTLAATPFLQDLVEHVERSDRRYDLSAFRAFCCGGSTIPRDLVERSKRVLGAELLPCYGMTECFMATVVAPDAGEQTKKNSDGRALPGVELKVVDDNGDEVPFGTEGELHVRGPNVMLGYLNPPDGFDFVPGGWLSTGDEVVLEADGDLRIVGRRKDIIIRGGLNISPREVEEVIMQHPAVRRVSVVGYPEQRLGERSCAIVVPQGSPPTLEEITDFLRARGVANYKLPERLEIVDDMPMTSSGKIQKTKLRSWLIDHIKCDAGAGSDNLEEAAR